MKASLGCVLYQICLDTGMRVRLHLKLLERSAVTARIRPGQAALRPVAATDDAMGDWREGASRDGVRSEYPLGSSTTVFPSVAALALLLLVAAILFTPILDGYWLADDFDWVQTWLHPNWEQVPRLFRGDWAKAASNEYRPLWALSVMADLGIWGANPRALHATNLGLHLLASLLVWYLAAGVSGANRAAPVLAVAIFVFAPIHDEPVAWISARGHILAPLFMLSAAVLLRRFETYGGIVSYLASIGAALGAFATQEVAVALPALLLLRAIVEAPKPNQKWLVATAARHLPYWIVLAAYLGLRLAIFGRLGRESMPSSALAAIQAIYISFRTLWLMPNSISELPGWFTGAPMKTLLVLIIAWLLVAPIVVLGSNGRLVYVRRLCYFAIGWPLIALAVLMGANSARHFYLASVGPAVALGLAASYLLAARRPIAIIGGVVAALLLVIYGWALNHSLAGYALNGARSAQLMEQVEATMLEAGHDTDAIVVIIPELPDTRRVFWDYFYPAAISPPFVAKAARVSVIPSFASCHCAPQQWLLEHGATLHRIYRGRTGALYVIQWNEQQGAFLTRRLDQNSFQKAGYAAPGGPLIRPRWPGQPEIRLGY